MEIEVELGSGMKKTPLHYVDESEKMYMIDKGLLDINVNGTWNRFPPMSAVTIRKGIVHAIKNSTTQKIVFKTSFEPALLYEKFYF